MFSANDQVSYDTRDMLPHYDFNTTNAILMYTKSCIDVNYKIATDGGAFFHTNPTI